MICAAFGSTRIVCYLTKRVNDGGFSKTKILGNEEGSNEHFCEPDIINRVEHMCLKGETELDLTQLSNW